MALDPFDTPVLFGLGRWFCKVVLEDFFYYEFFHEEYVPRQGPCLLACNHVSFLDPPAAVIGGHRNCYSFARKTLFKKGLWKWLFERFLTIPVDRDGGNDISSIRTVLKLLADDQAVLLFPEGSRSFDGALQKPKRGMGLVAALSQVPVVPVRIFGSFDAMGRTLPHPRWFTPVRIVYGEPLSPQQYDPGKTDPDRYNTVAQRVMDAIESIDDPWPESRHQLFPR